MKIPCPACAAKYSVADDKIQSRLAKIRCRKCGVTIVIDGTVTPINVYVGEGGQKSAAATSLPGISSPSDDSGRAGFDASPGENGAADSAGPSLNEYAVDIADNDQRNMTLEGVVTAYNAGLVTAETYVWKEGMPDWQMLAEVPEIYSALHAAARNSGSSRNSGSPFGRQPGSPDLFGGIHAAGTEHDLGASSQDGQFVAAGTGARNESSVLFSLSALSGPAVPGSPGGGKAGKGRTEDSGLIDLQALTAASESAGAAYAPQHQQTPFGGSALISAPLGGVSSSTMNGAFAGYSKRSSSKTGFIVGGATFVLLAAIGAFVFIMKSGDASVSSAEVDGKSIAEQSDPSVRHPSKAGAQAEQEQAAAAPESESETAEPAEEPAAPVVKPAKPAAQAAQAVAEPAPIRRQAPPAPRRTTPASLPKPAPAAVAENPKPAPAPAAPAAQPAEPAAPKKKKACECKPADLLCAMRCSASK